MSRRPRAARASVRLALVTGLAALCAPWAAGGVASAAPSSTLVYSVDGGSTWSPNVTAAPGQAVIARQYYSNDTAGTLTGASVTTTLPAGFTLRAGTTEVCLNPGTTDPTHPTPELECNTSTGGSAAPNDQGGPINESAVWSASTLTISPSAGLFGQPTGQTSGPMAEGMAKYLNLDQCVYTNSTTNNFTSLVPLPGNPNYSSGTNVANTAASTACGPGGGSYTPQGGTGVANYSLLGQAYFNLNQCYYTTPVTAWVDPGTGGSNTDQNPTNSTGVAPNCPGSVPSNSGILSMSLLGNQYVNLDECTYLGPTQSFSSAIHVANTGGGFDAGSNASTTPQTTDTCGPGISGWAPSAANDGVLALHYLDTTRGQGFVEWQMTAPSPAVTTTYPETGQLTGPGTGDPSASGGITVDASVGASLADPWVGGGLAGLAGLAAVVGLAWRRRAGAHAG